MKFDPLTWRPPPLTDSPFFRPFDPAVARIRVESKICREPMIVRCRVCKKETGEKTRILGDNWITCDSCREKEKRAREEEREREAERQQKEWKEARKREAEEEEKARIAAQRECRECGRSYDSRGYNSCLCPSCYDKWLEERRI